MSDAREPGRDPSAAPYLRLPMPLVAGVLLVFLAALLALGLYANRNLRPQGIVVPTEAPNPAAGTPVVAAAAPTSPVLAKQDFSTVTAAPTSLVQDTGATAREVRPSPTVALTLAETPVGSTNATPVPTLDPALVAEVTSAFDEYWRIRTQALLDLDNTHLSEVMAGDHLQVITRRIDELRAENRVIKSDIDHDIRVIDVSSDSARIIDDYISDSVYVDPVTKEKLTAPASDELRVLYRLRRIDGRWKVVDSVVQS